MNELYTRMIVLCVMGNLALFFVVIFLVLRNMRKVLRVYLDRKFAAADVLLESMGANYFGQTSRGMAQFRGNGALVLTRLGLYFVMYLPRREFAVPLDRITGITTPSSFLGKTRFQPLLCVHFKATAGQGNETEDAMAWLVRDAEVWKRRIEELRKAGD